MAATTEGLRERKKRETRETIVRAAWRLFARRGFDAVTVADIARAANVSEKTVFNYFPAKEDLVFHRREERIAVLIDAVRSRPPGTPLLEPFRAWTLAFLDQVERGPIEEIVAIPRLVMQSRALRERLFIRWEEEAALLAELIAQERGLPGDSLEASVVARALAWTHRIALRTAFARLLAGEDRRLVARRLRSEGERAYDLIARGLGDY
jgi:AcrR family transcriptional regulator